MVLRIKLEIVPFGIESKTREIGRLEIFNEQQIDFDKYAYGVIDLTKGEEGMYLMYVTHHRSKGAWVLVDKILQELKLKK